MSKKYGSLERTWLGFSCLYSTGGRRVPKNLPKQTNKQKNVTSRLYEVFVHHVTCILILASSSCGSIGCFNEHLERILTFKNIRNAIKLVRFNPPHQLLSVSSNVYSNITATICLQRQVKTPWRIDQDHILYRPALPTFYFDRYSSLKKQTNKQKDKPVTAVRRPCGCTGNNTLRDAHL